MLKIILAKLNIKTFDSEVFLFGEHDLGLNVIFLVAKVMIWKCSFNNQDFSIDEFIHKVKMQILADANVLPDNIIKIKWEDYAFIIEL